MLYEHVLRRILFAMDPEDAHLRTMAMLRLAAPGLRTIAPAFRVRDERLQIEAFGLRFPAPIGVAAGLDKHAEACTAWAALGAGFVEVGTVTPRPQEGNPRPRVFRLVEDCALINRMGFNSEGAEVVAARLRAVGERGGPVGVNVGRNRETPNESATDDYRRAIAALAPVADYLAINVSSPNTPGLRDLQRPSAIGDLVRVAIGSVSECRPRRPVLVKLSPDLTWEEMDETVDAVVSAGADGIIATNTTIARDGLRSPRAAEPGGLSGAPLRDRANQACRRIYRRTDGRVPLIGVGGIFTARDAYERIRSGATLVQVYTSLIYEGPGVFRRINRGLLQLLDRDRLSRLSAAIGADAS